MKKLAFLILIAVLPFVGFSEEQGNCGFMQSLNVLFGLGMTNENGASSYNSALGGLVGIETTLYNFNENTSFRTGINFSLQGANYTDSYDTDYYTQVLKSAQAGNEFSGKVSLFYLNIPFYFHYQTNMGFYAEGGIQPGFLLSAKDKLEGGESYDFKDASKSFKLGIPLGVGYAINNRLSIGARSIIGITDNIIEEDFMTGGEKKSKEFMLVGVVKIRLFSD